MKVARRGIPRCFANQNSPAAGQTGTEEDFLSQIARDGK